MHAQGVRGLYAGRMTRMALWLVRALLVMAVPLALWRLAYPLTDWAALALIPLGAAIWLGFYRPLLGRRRAELAVAIRPESRLGFWLTGRLGAALGATAGVVIGLPVLAWAGLRSQGLVLGLLLALCMLSGLLAIMAERGLGRSLTAPYARVMGQRIGSGAAAMIGLIPLVWLNWAVIPVPHGITGMGLPEAVSAVIAQLPARGTLLDEALGGFAALDTAKLWLAAQYRGAAWVGLVFSLDAALVAFVTARSFVAVLDFTRQDGAT